MSSSPSLRRQDKAMDKAASEAFLAEAYCGRLATLGEDGYPYCLPLLFIWSGGKLYFHNTGARGHLRANVAFCQKACFEVDEAGPVFDYGRFECDSTLAFRSVILFGRVSIVEEDAQKRAFFDALMEKYRKSGPERPPNFYPRLDETTVYMMEVESMTGKLSPLPPASEQWPAKDRSKSPRAVPPGEKGKSL